MVKNMIGIAIIGCGKQGTKLLNAFSSLDGCEVKVCFSRTDDKKLAEVKKKYPKVTTTHDLSEVFSDEVDAVVIASPDHTHFGLVLMALDADKHVFVEKPIANRYIEAVELIEKAISKGKTLMAGHVMAFHPGVEFIKKEAKGIRLVKSYRFDVGKLHPMSDAISGSLVHDVSMVARLIDGDVLLVRSDYICSDDLAESVQAEIRFFTGEKAFVSADLMSPQRGRLFTVLTPSKLYSFDGYSKVSIYNVSEDGTSIELSEERTVENNPIELECRAFLDLIRNRKDNCASGGQLLRVMKILEEIRKGRIL